MFNRVQVWALAGPLKRSGADHHQEPHSMMLPAQHWGTILTRWWAMPDFFQPWHLGFRLNTSIFVSLALRPDCSNGSETPSVKNDCLRSVKGHEGSKCWLMVGTSFFLSTYGEDACMQTSKHRKKPPYIIGMCVCVGLHNRFSIIGKTGNPPLASTQHHRIILLRNESLSHLHKRLLLIRKTGNPPLPSFMTVSSLTKAFLPWFLKLDKGPARKSLMSRLVGVRWT